MAEKLAFLVNKKTNVIVNRIIVDDEKTYTPETGLKVVFPDEEKREHEQDIGEKFGQVKPLVPEGFYADKGE